MSMSMHVKGVPEREYFDKMLDLKEYCERMNVGYPKEVEEYFGDMVEEPRECLENEQLYVEVPFEKYAADMKEGFDIDVSKIPPGIKTIRFYCSW